MAIKKFKVEAIRTDEYKIEFDESIINAEWLKSFGAVFHEVDDLEELAKDLAFGMLRFGSDAFIEGFGRVQCFYKDGTEKGYLSKEEEYAPGIKVTVITEDDDHDFDVTEQE